MRRSGSRSAIPTWPAGPSGVELIGFLPEATLDQYVAEHVGAVGDEPVHAQVEQVLHLSTIVDGPDMDLPTERVCVADVVPVDGTEPAPSWRHLVSRTRVAQEPLHVATGTAQQQGGRRDHAAAGGHRSGAASREPTPEVPQDALVERSDTHAVMPLGADDELDHGLDGPGRLQVDVETGSREGLEQVDEARDRLAATDEHRAYVGVRQIAQPLRRTGHPLQHGIVEGDQLSVVGRVHVGLQVAVAEGRRVLEGEHGVLETGYVRMAGSAAVGEGEDAAVLHRFVEEAETGARPRGAAARGHAGSIHPHASSVPAMDDMTCPKCSGAMQRRQLGDVVVARCSSCSGIFLERSELGLLSEAENDWHRGASAHTEPMPRITTEMTTPPRSRPRARSFLETLFLG